MTTQQSQIDHVKFDEQVLAEHDLDRGTRMKIDEPKTPYHEEHEEQEVKCAGEQEDVEMKDIGYQPDDQEIKKHLDEAERNKQHNAQLQKEQQNIKNFHSELQQKLDQTSVTQDEEERKHVEFQKKRKEHYKNEFSPAMLLKQQVRAEDEEDEDSKEQS